MEFKDLKLSTGGDVAAAGIGAAIGGAIDAFFFTGGLPTTTVAALAAAGAVGIKRAVQSFLEPALERSREKKRLEMRVRALLRFQRGTDRDWLAYCFQLWSSGAIENATLVHVAMTAESRALENGPQQRSALFPNATDTEKKPVVST